MIVVVFNACGNYLFHTNMESPLVSTSQCAHPCLTTSALRTLLGPGKYQIVKRRTIVRTNIMIVLKISRNKRILIVFSIDRNPYIEEPQK